MPNAEYRMNKRSASPHSFIRHSSLGVHYSASILGGGDHPLSIGWLVAVAGAILYGSLIPFTIDPNWFSTANAFGLADLSMFPSTLEDIVTNVLIYMPLGAALVIARPVRVGSVFSRVLAGAGLGLCVSLPIETLQTGMAIRVASWVDVLMNTVGAGVGALAAPWMLRLGRRLIESARLRFSMNPMMTGATALSAGLLVYSLAPFDFVCNTAGLHAGFLRADWNLWPSWTAVLVPGLVGTAADCGWFVLLGYCVARGRRLSGWTWGAALISAVKHCALLAVVIEITQLFTASHVVGLFDLWAHAFCGGLGAVLATGARVLAADRRGASLNPWGAVPLTGLAAAGALLAADLIISSTNSFTFFGGQSASTQANLIPFEALWRLPMLTALGRLVAMTMAYAIITMTMAVVLRRWFGSRCWLPAAVFTTLLVCLIEASQLAVSMRVADVTEPIVALTAAVITARVFQWLRPAGQTLEASTVVSNRRDLW